MDCKALEKVFDYSFKPQILFGKQGGRKLLHLSHFEDIKGSYRHYQNNPNSWCQSYEPLVDT